MMRRNLFLRTVLILSAPSFAITALAQAAPPDLNGVWGIYRGGRGSDPKLAAPPSGPLVLKPEYAKPYEARRAEESEAARRGEQLANRSVQCLPYGMPTMMAVAVYPVEIIQTPKQVTIVAEAFS